MPAIGRALRAAGAAAALAGLVGGLPAVLYAAGGPPVPRTPPSWHQLLAEAARPADAGVFLGAVRVVSWVAWAAFMICVLAEVIAAVRGRPPRLLRALGPVQGLAAVLVSTAITGAAAAPAAAQPAAHQQAASPPRPGLPPGGGHDAGRRVVYRVRPGDSLWDIAEDRLGSGLAWHRIWELNKDRPQSGGGELTTPDLIQPGWLLRLPRPAGHHPRRPPPRRIGRPPRPAPPASHRSRPCPARPRPGDYAPHSAPGPGVSLPAGGLAGAGLAAAVAAALALAAVHRRRRYRPGGALAGRGDPPVPLVPPAIAALRRASRPSPPEDPGGDTEPSCSPVPGVLGPGPGEDAAAPPRASAAAWPYAARPATSSAGGSGRPGPVPGLGRARPALLAAAPGAAKLATPRPAPWPAAPGELAVGVRDGREITADLAALGGLGLTGLGSPGAARALLADLLSRVVPGSPHPPAEVIVPAADARLLLPGHQPGGLAGLPGLALAPSPAAALARAEELIIRRARLSAGGATDGGEVPGLPPAALIATPATPVAARLAAVARAGQTTGLAVIVLGDWPAGTTCHVTADGTVSCADPRLDGVRLFSLTAADTAAVVAVLREASGDTPARPPAPQTATAPPPRLPAPAPAPRPAAPPASPDPVPARPPSSASPAGQPAPAAPDSQILRVEVLGPLRITARGTEITGGLRKARELAGYLAVHPAGATPEAITEALWPDSRNGPAQRALALRKLRDLLRRAARVTEPKMVILSAGRYRLDPSLIGTDYADFHAALDQARHAATGQARLVACQQAAGLYRGELADGAGYGWAESHAETLRRRALDAWTTIAGILQPTDPARALAALECALSHDPYNEYLYQRIMQLQAAAGHADAARRTLSLLETRLAGLGITPGAQTRQVAAALLGPPRLASPL